MDKCIHSWYSVGGPFAKCEKCKMVRYASDILRPQQEQTVSKIKVKITPKIAKINDSWFPLIVVNGHQQGDTYAGPFTHKYGRDEAIQLANDAAANAAALYLGDWEVTITDLEE